MKEKKDKYILTSTVNYPNNKSLVKQKVYINKDGKITKTEVTDKNGNVEIEMTFNKQEYNKKFDKNYFELNSLLKINNNKPTKEEPKKEEPKNNNETTPNTNNNSSNNSTNEASTNTNENNNTNNNTQTNPEEKQETKKTNPTASINDIVYPMYLPNNTYLTSQEKTSTKDGERLILTFSGDSSFVLVEETSKITDDHVIIPTSGEFDFLTDVIGIIGKHSLSWNSNGIDYYLASDIIETSELLDIARSISILPVSK